MISSPSPSGPPTPAPIAASVDDDDDDDDDDDAVPWTGREFVAEAVAVTVIGAAVAVIVTGATFVLLGDVEPDVRLKITSPALMKNGDVLPLVATLQVLLDGSAWPQQNTGRNRSLSISRRCIFNPSLVLTVMPIILA